MAPHWLSNLASIGMAVGPPLVYADQTVSIIKKKARASTSFSRDICAVLLVTNITRCFFWLGEHIEFALLMQSMILCQLELLYTCVLYRPRLSPDNFGASSRPLSFEQWATYSQHIEFLAGYIVFLTILVLIFRRLEVFVWLLGFFALGVMPQTREGRTVRINSTCALVAVVSKLKINSRNRYSYQNRRVRSGKV
ncbi:hypothetical protein V8E53_005211 [Lactarius tabidus]